MFPLLDHFRLELYKASSSGHNFSQRVLEYKLSTQDMWFTPLNIYILHTAIIKMNKHVKQVLEKSIQQTTSSFRQRSISAKKYIQSGELGIRTTAGCYYCTQQ
ncbi:hypothetical protein TorRG33x02_195340 [Trema orientale]|uniref:Uncharacterized protein n=1 Tax=Trema orientale TaxID=63057 RepID=A0A2P5EGM4_TREOI|nr:hypothetical protein TorRG33x02_195340 [Trema orientale]